MYSDAQETLINLFEDALILVKSFNRDVYKSDFETHYNKYKDFFVNVNESLRRGRKRSGNLRTCRNYS